MAHNDHIPTAVDPHRRARPANDGQRRAVSAPTGIDGQLRTYQPGARRWQAWQRHQPTLDGVSFTEMRQLLLDRACAPQRKDALLLALVRLAGVDDEAAVCVSACLYPGLRRIAWRFRDVLDRDDAWAGLAEAVTKQVRAFDVEHQLQFVAATLLRDAAHGLRRAVRAERAWRDHVELHDRPVVEMITPPVGDPHNDPLDGVGGLTQLDAALIRATRVGGLSLVEAASLLGLSYEAAKKRRQRAEVVWLTTAGISTTRRARRASSGNRFAA